MFVYFETLFKKKKDNLIKFRQNRNFTNQKTGSRYQIANYDVSGKEPIY